VFGKPSAYYGTVEQQGRMTLHLHFLLWIEGSIPLQEVHDRLLAQDSEFQKELTSYLESCHMGEFKTGSLEQLKSSIPPYAKKDSTQVNTDEPHEYINGETYLDPTLTLPEPPPQGYCENPSSCICTKCDDLRAWYDHFERTVDDIMVRSNVHKCFAKHDNGADGSDDSTCGKKYHATGKGCQDRNGVCTSRFPREVFTETTVDAETGHISMKKLEPWINTVTPTVVAVSRCNTDTTCLLSGTAVKATVGYVTDYLTKSSLKTYQVFSTMYDIFSR
ncbi:hypothetical protein BJ165DRAFT_1313020, partial [Panaeolus papilionaceus]